MSAQRYLHPICNLVSIGGEPSADDLVYYTDYVALEKLCRQQHEALVAMFGFFDSGEFVRNTSHDSEEGWHLKMISIFKSLSDGQAALNAYAALFPKTGGAK